MKKSYKKSMNGGKKRSRKGSKKSIKKSIKKTGKKLKKMFHLGGYTQAQTRAILARKDAMSRKAEKMTNTTDIRCPRGQVKRRGYITKKGRVVGASCIENKGKPGKGPRAIILKKGAMSKYGYNNIDKKTATERRAALKKAVKADGPVEVIRRLIALSNLKMRTNPTFSKKVKSDQEWVSKTYNA